MEATVDTEAVLGSVMIDLLLKDIAGRDIVTTGEMIDRLLDLRNVVAQQEQLN